MDCFRFYFCYGFFEFISDFVKILLFLQLFLRFSQFIEKSFEVNGEVISVGIVIADCRFLDCGGRKIE